MSFLSYFLIQEESEEKVNEIEKSIIEKSLLQKDKLYDLCENLNIEYLFSSKKVFFGIWNTFLYYNFIRLDKFIEKYQSHVIFKNNFEDKKIDNLPNSIKNQICKNNCINKLNFCQNEGIASFMNHELCLKYYIETKKPNSNTVEFLNSISYNKLDRDDKFILDKMIDITERKKCNIVDIACLKGNIKIIEYLHENGYMGTSEEEKCAINFSVFFKNVKLMKYLIENGYKGTSEEGGCTIDLAILLEDVELLKYLHEKKYKGSLNLGCYALDSLKIAIQSGNLDIVKYLYDYGYWEEERCLGTLNIEYAKEHRNIYNYMITNNHHIPAKECGCFS